MLAEMQESQNQLADQVSAEQAVGQISLLDLAEILDQHKMWVESGGESGVKADLPLAYPSSPIIYPMQRCKACTNVATATFPLRVLKAGDWVPKVKG